MAAQHELALWASERTHADRVARVAVGDVLRIEAKFSRYRDDSVTTAINRSAGRAAVAIDAETASLLRYADRCHALSGGRFDLTSGVLRRAWDFKRRPPLVPTDDEIDAARELIGWTRVEWDERSARLPLAGMELDFGGVGKEYAADRAAAICRDHGIAHGYVNLGGDVRVIGGHPDGTPWRIGIRHPRDAAAVVCTVLVTDGAVATSGDYERYFEANGRRYCHLLDARTGRPVSSRRSRFSPAATRRSRCCSKALPRHSSPHRTCATCSWGPTARSRRADSTRRARFRCVDPAGVRTRPGRRAASVRYDCRDAVLFRHDRRRP